jgi:hypothetical protein
MLNGKRSALLSGSAYSEYNVFTARHRSLGIHKLPTVINGIYWEGTGGKGYLGFRTQSPGS